MYFSKKTINSHSSCIHLLSYEEFDTLEFISKLTDIETERFFSFKNINRRREFVATRILRHQLFGFQHMHYDSLGAPYIPNEGFISVSHSKNLIGIAVNEEYKVGLDLESHRKNILDLKTKFLSENEFTQFNCDNYIEVTKIWSAKEALYKLAGRKKILFSKELILSKDSNDCWNGTIINHDHDLKVKMDIFDIDETIISINSAKIERV